MAFQDRSRRPGRQLADARGFTMVELLVVILIVGILAMIALPAFLTQRAKGEDTEAQTTVRTAHTALATHHTDEATYDATLAELRATEPALGEASPDLDVTGTRNTFVITEKSASGTTFTLTRTAADATQRTCSDHGRGMCRSSADASGNWW